MLRLGPYSQTWLATHDADRLNTELAGKAATVLPRRRDRRGKARIGTPDDTP
ncbi:hypothetical protein ACIBW9_36920 [Streptomyces sp. NPDC049541]|uniref:hypothetical protein n=1 Tax=Streptomyces sp. NPDC049541 TaxID=3365594 RepID=UPI0037A563B6